MIPDVRSVNDDGSIVGFCDPADQTEQCALAAPRVSDNRYEVSLINGQGGWQDCGDNAA